ncbi:MAG: formyl transferase [Gemmatimonadetes bacterium]|nr:formyl transferase [Gemmatimonadota bacterium]
MDSLTSARPRIVVLSKRLRLTSYLVQELRKAGVLAGVIYEERFRSTGDTLKYLRRNVKREGFVHTLDVLAYEVFQRLTRQGEFAANAARLLPLDGPEEAVAGDVPVHVVADHNAPSTHALIRALAPDLLVVHACGILKEATFSLGATAALNIHCGVLPEYRGHASTFWAMARRDAGNVGVTVHLVAKTVDTGRPIAVGRVPVGADDDDMTMWFRAFKRGTEIVLHAADTLARTGALPFEQYDGAFGPHYVRRGLTQHVRFRLGALPALRRAARRDDATLRSA